MPANLLILPLLAGYWLIHRSHRFRFKAQRYDGHRLLIGSALAGALVLVLARLMIILVKLTPWGAPLKSAWNQFAPIDYMGTSTLALVLGLLFPVVDNHFPWRHFGRLWQRAGWRKRLIEISDQKKAAFRASEIEANGSALARLLHRAETNSEMVAVTLASRKWYVGYVAEAWNLDPQESCFRLLPVMSGYRDKDTLKVNVTERYDFIHADAELSSQDFILVIPLKDVQVANLFDQTVFERYFSQAPQGDYVLDD